VDDFKINSMQGELGFGGFTTVTKGVDSNGEHIDAVNINEVNFTKFITYDNNNVKGKNTSFLAYSEGNIDADETVGLRMIRFDIRRETNSHEQVAVQAYHDDEDYTFDDDTISYQAHKGGNDYHSSSGDYGDSYSSTSEYEGGSGYHSSLGDYGDSYPSSSENEGGSDYHSSSGEYGDSYSLPSEHEGGSDYHSYSGDSSSSSEHKGDNSDSHSSSYAAYQQHTTTTTAVKKPMCHSKVGCCYILFNQNAGMKKGSLKKTQKDKIAEQVLESWKTKEEVPLKNMETTV
jgi:hypothetical protein